MAWTWPHLTLIRDLLARWGGRQPSHVALGRALERLDALGDNNSRYEVTFGFKDRHWASCNARLAILAPLPADLNRSRRKLRKIVDWTTGRPPRLAVATVQRLLGQRSSGDHANLVSLAVSSQWAGWKLLLGGDLDVSRAPTQGWRGVIKELAREGQTGLVEDVDIIKVAHHGSSGAWLDKAWDLHARNRKVRAALVAPFDRSRLPTRDVLAKLRGQAEKVGLSSEAPAPRALAAGWDRTPSPTGDSVVVVRLRADGTYSFDARGSAAIYV